MKGKSLKLGRKCKKWAHSKGSVGACIYLNSRWMGSVQSEEVNPVDQEPKELLQNKSKEAIVFFLFFIFYFVFVFLGQGPSAQPWLS